MAYAILAWPGALFIGLSLGLLGSGGSIMTVPVLVYLLGQDEKVAIAGSMAIVGAIALAASIPYIREKRVDWTSVWLFGVPGMAGAWLGAWLSHWVSGTFQITVFAIVMLSVAWLMLRPLKLNDSAPRQRRAAWKIGIDGLVVGALTGFVGVGGGFMIVPALVLLGGLSMSLAVGTSLFIIAIKSFVGFWKYQEVLATQQLSLDWQVLLLVAAIGIVGSWFGHLFGGNLSQEKLKTIFGWFLVVMGIYILATSVPKII